MQTRLLTSSFPTTLIPQASLDGLLNRHRKRLSEEVQHSIDKIYDQDSWNRSYHMYACDAANVGFHEIYGHPEGRLAEGTKQYDIYTEAMHSWIQMFAVEMSRRLMITALRAENHELLND